MLQVLAVKCHVATPASPRALLCVARSGRQQPQHAKACPTSSPRPARGLRPFVLLPYDISRVILCRWFRAPPLSVAWTPRSPSIGHDAATRNAQGRLHGFRQVRPPLNKGFLPCSFWIRQVHRMPSTTTGPKPKFHVDLVPPTSQEPRSASPENPSTTTIDACTTTPGGIGSDKSNNDFAQPPTALNVCGNVYHYPCSNVHRTCTIDPRRPVDVKFLVLTPNTYGV
ncbi:hypothetical protein TRIUR3_34412 [Triticum urartu]|uniref:Uncharacterized protein n=1 Tax=Triticum urartu TaxID=4572 RepID=M8B2A4_TRIUA|nr:hypothetical protein TRIUR3_34412 [Triticum urartu]